MFSFLLSLCSAGISTRQHQHTAPCGAEEADPIGGTVCATNYSERQRYILREVDTDRAGDIPPIPTETSRCLIRAVARQAASAGGVGGVGMDAGAATALTVGEAGAFFGEIRFTRSSAGAAGAVAAAALIVGGAGAANRGATLSTTLLLSGRTLTLTRRAVIGLPCNFGAGGFGEAWSAPPGFRTPEASPFPALGLAYAFPLLWSTRTEEALTEVGAATPAALSCPGHPRQGG